MIRTAFLLALILAHPAGAMTLPEGATLAASDGSPRDTLVFPVGPWDAGGTPAQTVEGAVRREAWILAETERTTAEILAPLQEALEADDFNVLFACRDTDCGGFDFRYELDLIQEPDMHVDLGDFRYLAARKSGAKDIVTLVISRSGTSGYVHIARVGDATPTETEASSGGSEPTPVLGVALPGPSATLIERLTGSGHTVLEDLVFATGSATLESSAFPSLTELAGWLRADATRRVVLVGHSDAVGALDRNVSLSRARARAVLDRLVDSHDVPRAQLSAEGIGFLSPRASSETDAGRAANRRVEVVIPAP